MDCHSLKHFKIPLKSDAAIKTLIQFIPLIHKQTRISIISFQLTQGTESLLDTVLI